MKLNHNTERLNAIKGFDLNLLTMFESVYIHGSITKAAGILGLTPSAVSQAIGRLRDHFSDPLFVRQGKNLSPTKTATGIHEKLFESYDNLLARFQEIDHPLAISNIVINCPPYLSLTMLGPLVRAIDKIAPGCKVTHTVVGNSSQAIDDLLTFRKTDIVFDINPHKNLSRNTFLLYEEPLVVIRAKNHPRIKDKASPEDVMKEEFTFISNDSLLRINLAQQLEKRISVKRKIRYYVGYIGAAMPVVEATDTLAFVPLKAYEEYKKQYDICAVNVDMNLPSIPVYMVYNKTSLNNQFFCKVIIALEEMFPPIPA